MEKVVIFILSLCTLANLTFVVNSNSLTLRLIHPHSPESPFFQANLSHEERIRKSALQSQLDSARARVDVQVFLYVVKVGIGTFKSTPPYKEYFLEMDTGSSLIWTQCEGCTKCFNQTTKPFPRKGSSSYTAGKTEQTYKVSYADGSGTRGVVARETFYLESMRRGGGITKIQNISFGCGLQNDMTFANRNNKIAGMMGLGWENISFVRQLGSQYKGRFSYCLPVIRSRKVPTNYLTFGDITTPRNAKTTTLYRTMQSTGYFVELRGISLNKNRLNINPQVFALQNGGRSGGCIFDSGTPYSRLVKPAYEVLKSELEKYFSRVKGLKRIKGNLGLEFCYETKSSEGLKNLPEITFHLQGSDFVLKGESGIVLRIHLDVFITCMFDMILKYWSGLA
ncbi:hypothetical protein ACS0TY_007747 [Phlomoides rotata]